MGVLVFVNMLGLLSMAELLVLQRYNHLVEGMGIYIRW